MSVSFARSVVRIDVDGKTKGTGFVGSNGMVITCAHVVADHRDSPCINISVIFRATGRAFNGHVRPEFWRPPKEEDVAVVRLDSELPTDINQLALGSSADVAGHPCVTFGFPSLGMIDGLWSHGTVDGPVAEFGGRQLIQVRSKEITEGFSGAPLFDKRTHQIIGMVSERANVERFNETAFATPSKILAEICPSLLRRGTNDRSPLQSRIAQRKLEGLQKQWDLVFDLLTRLERSAVLEVDVPSKLKLELQISDNQKKLAEIEEDIRRIEGPF
jgi:hypothetical protein